MKKILFFIVIMSLLLFTGTSALAATNSIDIDSTESERGIVKVKFNTGSENKIKLLVKRGASKYYYNLSNSEEYVNFPLQLGDGTYTTSIYENTSGNKYRKLRSESFAVTTEGNVVYLNSVQEISWNSENEAIKLADQLMIDEMIEKKIVVISEDAAAEIAKQLVFEALTAKRLTEGDEAVLLTNAEITRILYDYVVKNIRYDYQKIKTLDYSYLPSIDSTLETGTGICYDYSSLLASMLRSQGVPAKLIKGYTSWTSVYHAWNEIYLSDEERWAIVDTTYDSYMYLRDRAYTFEKELDVYSKSKEF